MNPTIINIFWMILGGGIVLIIAIVIFKVYQAGVREGRSQSQDD